MCYDATDVTDVCFAGTLVKSSVYMGTGRMPCVFGTRITGASTFSQGCGSISIDSHGSPFAAMPCHIAHHTGDWLICCDVFLCDVTFAGSSVTTRNVAVMRLSTA